MVTTTAHELSATIDPLLVTEPIACRMLGVGRTTIFHLRTIREIRSVLVKSKKSNVSGRRMYVVESLKEYVRKLEAEAVANTN